MTYVRNWDGFTVSDDRMRIDLDIVHGFLSEVYWSVGIPRETVERGIRNSHAFGLYQGEPPALGAQVGFARVVTDYTTFAWITDVFVLPPYRGRGLATFLNRCIVEHPDLQGLRRWLLRTRDAHAVYRRVGFDDIPDPDRFMTRHDPDVYRG